MKRPSARPSKREAARPAARATYREVDTELADQRLDNFLLRCLKGVPRSHVYRLVRSGQVRVNSGRVAPSYRLKAGDRVRIPPVDTTERVAPKLEGLGWLESKIAYEDRRLLVLDKPAGMAVHGGGSSGFGCIEALRSLRPRERLELVHRLDRETSGCLLVAKRPSALRLLHALIRDAGIEKRYIALVAGAWPRRRTRVEMPLRVRHSSGQASVSPDEQGKPALSRFRVVERFAPGHDKPGATLVEVTIVTGRTHQIRVHAASSGHPVAGDTRYGDADFNERLERFGLARMFLHASLIAFEWPDTQEPFTIELPLPSALQSVLDRLRGDGERVEARGA